MGMCFTGGFALGMMVDDVVLAPVLSQPSLPFPVTKSLRRDIGLSPADTARVQERAAAGTCVLGLRFTGDKFSPPERFEHLRELLGDSFVAVELDSSAGNPHGHKKTAHSVLTEDLDDRPGTPTRAALDQVLEFFRTQLHRVSRPAESWRARGRYLTLCGHRIFTVDVPAVGTEVHAPLLILHGFPTSSFDFHRIVDRLAEDRRVLLFDMLGYGFSDKPDRAYNFAIQADIAVAFLDAVGVNHLSLLTHDIGDTVGGELLARKSRGQLGRRDCRADTHQWEHLFRAHPIQCRAALPPRAPRSTATVDAPLDQAT